MLPKIRAFLLFHCHSIIVQTYYANDTLIFMQGCARQLFFLKILLNSFTEFTGLKVNFTKSMMVPIDVSDDWFYILVNTFQCFKGSLPFIYLELPLSLTKPSVVDFWPLVSRCERRLVSTSNFLSQAGWLELTTSFHYSTNLHYLHISSS